MSRKSDEQLMPRNGHTLVVVAVCRISGCQRQKEMSLEDQAQNAKEFVLDIYPHPIEFRYLATTAKGESLDRPELNEIEGLYRSRTVDLMLYDELSRLIRGGEAVRLLGIGVDHGTRTMCIGDGIDTAESTWEEDALNACSENVAFNERTSHRVKTRTMNRFKRFGFTPRRLIPGYDAPEGVTSFDDWVKDDAAQFWIEEGRKKLLKLGNYTAVADYFNALGIAVGPHCRTTTKWTGEMVKRFYSHPLLKGVARRGVRRSVKKHETGRRVPRRNPKGPNFYNCPHLAYMTVEEFDELQTVMAEIAKTYDTSVVKDNCRVGQPRKRTRFPGQFARCWYCGRRMVWGGNGRSDNLMCNGARSWNCWNSFSFSGAVATNNVVDCILRELSDLDGFDDQFRALVGAALETDVPELEQLRQQLRADERKLETEQANVKEAMRQFGPRTLVLEAMEEVEQLAASVVVQRRKVEALTGRAMHLPGSIPELRGLLEEEFTKVARESHDFNVLLQTVVTDFSVYLVRLCNGGGLFPRAKVTFALDGITTDLKRSGVAEQLLKREVTIDLFEPPERERIRPLASRLESEGHGPKAIAALIAEQTPWRPSSTAVQNALKLQKAMIAQKLSSPYVTLLAPPEGYKRMRRHLHERYSFQQLEGYSLPRL